MKKKKEIDYGCWKDRDDLLNAIRNENKLINKKLEKLHFPLKKNDDK
jgi:hypothetical protein